MTDVTSQIARLLAAVTATGAGSAFAVPAGTAKRTFQATVAGTGAVTATVLVEITNDGTNWLTLGTITLSGTTSDSDGFAADAPWAQVRGNVSAVSGTGAAVTLIMGV
jgi:hypothetical protein